MTAMTMKKNVFATRKSHPNLASKENLTALPSESWSEMHAPRCQNSFHLIRFVHHSATYEWKVIVSKRKQANPSLAFHNPQLIRQDRILGAAQLCSDLCDLAYSHSLMVFAHCMHQCHCVWRNLEVDSGGCNYQVPIMIRRTLRRKK